MKMYEKYLKIGNLLIAFDCKLINNKKKVNLK